LSLLDIPQAEQTLKSIVMELEDGAYSLLGNVTYGTDPKVLFKGANVVVFIGGFPRKEG